MAEAVAAIARVPGGDGRAEGRVRDLEAVVARVRMETPDTASLFLDLGHAPKDYRAGQFLTIDPHQFPFLEPVIAQVEDLKGTREKPRAYSIGSAPHEPHVMITIKEERFWPGESKYPPVLSPPLARHCPVGSRIAIRGFAGAYTFPGDVAERADTILHLCAGSGVVPNFALIKHSLHAGDGLRHVLLYSSKRKEDIIYYGDLVDLAAAHPDRLRVVHCLTRQDPVDVAPEGRRGRIDQQLIESCIPDPARYLAYCCGPGILPWERQEARAAGRQPEPRFVETVVAWLEEAGLSRKQIKRESWG